MTCLCLFLASCGDDAVDCSDPEGLINELNSEIDKVNNTAQIYANDPGNTDKCKDYQDALNDLIDYSESLLDCTDLNTANIQTNIDQARSSIASLNCN